MLKRAIVTLISVGAIVLAHFYGKYMPYRYLPWMAVTLVGVLYGIRVQSRPILIWIGAFYATASMFEIRDAGIELFVIQSSIFGTVIALWWYFARELNKRVAAVGLQKRDVLESIRLLKEKYATRLESLNHLERQVGGLLDLFEIAKDFNECLYFDQLISTLDRKAKEQMSFAALTLTLFTTYGDRDELRVRTMSIGKPGDTNLQMRDPNDFDRFCISQAKLSPQPSKWESQASIEGLYSAVDDIKFPLWIFPLQVEGRLIAVLAIEGASEDHFPKFELLASQLALQVKKISLYERVKELSIIDGLTKVYVRRHFLERFEEELKRAVVRKTPISVLMLDIDHFKSYNDNFGHLVGDSTLREVAQVIRDSVRKVDLLARYGGEEFIVAMPDVGYSSNLESAERIRSAIARKSFRLYDEETKVTISIGVASFPEDAKDFRSKTFDSSLILNLIQKADKALYRAKEEGRNRVVSYQQIKTQNEAV